MLHLVKATVSCQKQFQKAEFCSRTGQGGEMVNTRRLRIQLFQSDRSWPYISDNTLHEWRTGMEVIIYGKGCNKSLDGGTFLKAFYGAPCWTLGELRRFRDAFSAGGISCLKKLPSEKSLSATGQLGKQFKRKRAVQEVNSDEPLAKRSMIE
jgi:hypothetical protein